MIATHKPRRGRPRSLAPELSERIQIRCSADELARWQAAADGAAIPLSTWIRLALRWPPNRKEWAECTTLELGHSNP